MKEDIKERTKRIKPISEAFEKWTRSLFTKNYLWFCKSKTFAAIRCSKCGAEYTVRIKKSSESYEAQFEKIHENPCHNKEGVCDRCGATGQYKSSEKLKNPIVDKAHCYLFQKSGKTDIVIRYFIIERECTKNLQQVFDTNEIARIWIQDEKKHVQKDFHVYNPYLGKNEWWDHNIGGMNNISIGTGLIYKGYKNVIQNSFLKYSGYELYQKEITLMESQESRNRKMIDYLIAYANCRELEMIQKMGLVNLKRHIICKEGKTSLINKKKKKIHEKLMINQYRMQDVIRTRGNTKFIKAYQVEKMSGTKISEETIKEVIKLSGFITQNDWKTALKYTTIEKLTNYIHKNKYHTYQYFDYIRMREENGYDMSNSVYVFPKNLNRAHKLMVEEANARKNEEFAKTMNVKYSKIAEKYEYLNKKMSYKKGNLIIRPVMDVTELIKEGHTLHHCVGATENYMMKHDEGSTYIFVIRKNNEPEKPYYTVEIEPNYKIRQWYGNMDKKPDYEEIREFLIDYTRKKAKNVEQKNLKYDDYWATKKHNAM
ncbi:MAG: PcfJ domain-containing protein [bacterium]|nr:PcfJ domain-containing protein [bacterium]